MKKNSAEKKAPNVGEFMGVAGVRLSEVSFSFNQDSDTNQSDDIGQEIEITTHDSGGGVYIVIKTDRWAMDVDDIDKFCETLKKIVKIPRNKMSHEIESADNGWIISYWVDDVKHYRVFEVSDDIDTMREDPQALIDLALFCERGNLWSDVFKT